MQNKQFLLGLFLSLVFFCNNPTENNYNDSEGTGTVTDVDGNIYTTMKIDNQEWMVENLRTTKYNNGTPIPLKTSNAAWSTTTPGYCYYTSDVDDIKKYGAIYNWYAANTDGLAPSGWHVANNDDWEILMHSSIKGGVPGLCRSQDGVFTKDEVYLWWSASDVTLSNGSKSSDAPVSNGSELVYTNKHVGLPIRCVKN